MINISRDSSHFFSFLLPIQINSVIVQHQIVGMTEKVQCSQHLAKSIDNEGGRRRWKSKSFDQKKQHDVGRL